MPNLWPVFPYTNFHQLNLDWLLTKIKELDNRVTNDIESEIVAYIQQHMADFIIQVTYQEAQKQMTIEVTNL